MSNVLKHVTANIGVITGGSKVNIIPGKCEVEVDIRVPLGVTWETIYKELKNKIEKVDPSIEIEYMRDDSILFQSSYTSTNERIFKLLKKNAHIITKVEPLISFTSGGTDCRFFRDRGVPSVLYGPKAHKMAAADEYITADELITIAKVHTGTIIDYLNN
jgi:succinyl-diaminopimelate desuccinylase